MHPCPGPSSSPSQLALLALLSMALACSQVMAKPMAPQEGHADEKRLYIPVMISSDAIMASLAGRHLDADASDMIRDNGLERKRTAAARLEYLDSLIPRSADHKRKMFWSPLGYMSASARRLNQNNPGHQPQANQEGGGTQGFRYG